MLSSARLPQDMPSSRTLHGLGLDVATPAEPERQGLFMATPPRQSMCPPAGAIHGNAAASEHFHVSSEHVSAGAFMATPPGHPFIAFVIGHLRALEAASVLRSTGPSMLTGALKAWQNRGLEQVQLLPGSALYPECGRGTPSEIRNCTVQWPDAWATTFWTQSWTTKYHRIAFVDDSGECIRDDPFASRRCEVGKGKARGSGKGESRAHATGRAARHRTGAEQ